MNRLRVAMRAFVICGVLLPALLFSLAACSGGKQTINGQVTALDPSARTFSVRATDGKQYDFAIPAGDTTIDITHLKEHMDEKKQVKVEFTGSRPPYVASYAH